MPKSALITALICSLSLSAMTLSQAAGLADLHIAKSMSCRTCHDTDKVVAGDIVDNERCLKCHGPLKSLQKKFANRGSKNPHKNHLGEIECGLCHAGHKPAKSYCMNCHKNFEMPMK